jgi:MFS family permease
VFGSVLLLVTPPGADLPAQVYRAHMFARGLTLWDGQWYGGHYLPSYSLLTPALAAVFGPRLLALIAAVASSALFGSIATTHFGRRARPAAFLFAAVVLADVAVGRTAFALGQALALTCLLFLLRGAPWRAYAFAALAAAASPVAAALLALVASAGWIVTQRRPALAVAAAAGVPVILVALAFPDGGTQPFRVTSLIGICVLAAVAGVLMPRQERALRAGAVAYGLACVLAYVVPTPLGSNVLRLGMLFGAPVVLAALWPRRSLVVAAAVVPMVIWQAMPAVSAIAHADGDKSLAPSYYTPLLRYIDRVGDHTTRIEIPMTLNHWESAYVAPHVAMARGWERQLDVRYNGLFYGGRLNAKTYRHWLFANGIRYVALPDARLDFSAVAEAALIAKRPSYLQPVFKSRHWTVFRVQGSPKLATGVLHLDALYPAGFDLRARRTGSGVVRVHYSKLLTVAHGHACLEPTPGGWTRVVAHSPGTVRVTVQWPSSERSRCQARKG